MARISVYLITSASMLLLVSCGLDEEGSGGSAEAAGAAGTSSGGSAGVATSGGGGGAGLAAGSGGVAGVAANAGAAGAGGSAGSGGSAGGSGGATGGVGGVGGTTGGSGGTTGGTGGATGGTGGATGGTGGTTGPPPSCSTLYGGQVGVLQVCSGTHDECRIYHDNDPNDGDPGKTCASICAAGGGQCHAVYDDSGACNPDFGDQRTCTTNTMSSAMCFCSRGCAPGYPCPNGRNCVGGFCV